MGPIGVFDSGYGGLTVLAEIRKELPEYDFLYFGDNARAPYGTRSFDLVYDYTLEAVEELFSRGCHLVVLACNTASAKALRTIQQRDLPFIAPDKRVLGVIRPSVEIMDQLTKSNKIGVLATEGTVRSNSYQIEINKLFPEIKVYQQACPMWVSLIENEEHESVAGRMFIERDVKSLLEQDPEIDTILLGCTHYPIVKGFIEQIVPPGVRIISQGDIVADRLRDYLERHPELELKISKNHSVKFLTSENTDEFNRKGEKFLGEPIQSSHVKW